MDPIFEKGENGEYTCGIEGCVPATSAPLREAALAYLRDVQGKPFFDSNTFVRMTDLELDFNGREAPAVYSEYAQSLRGVRAQPWHS